METYFIRYSERRLRLNGILLPSIASLPFRFWRAVSGYDVFISYASHDEGYADALAGRLRQHGFRVVRRQPGAAMDAALKAARRSRMMVVIVTDEAIASDSVHGEIEAFLRAPGPRRVVGIHFKAAYPQILPGAFDALKSYRGIRANPPDLDPPVVSDDVVWQVRQAFRAVRMRIVQIASALVVAVIALVSFFVQSRSRTKIEVRGHWLHNAEAARREFRYDATELAIANAAAAYPASAGELLDLYREARAARRLVPKFQTGVPRSFKLIHLGSDGVEPFAVYQDQEGGSLWLDSGNQRTLIARNCRPGANPVSRTLELIFACGGYLTAIDISKPSEVRRAGAGLEPVAIALAGDELRTLERVRGKLPSLKAWDPQSLELRWSKELPGAPAAGEAGICSAPEELAWTVNLEDRRIAIRRWARADAAPDIQRPAEASSVTGVAAAPGCDRFFLNAAGLGFLRIRLSAPVAVQRFDTGARQVEPVDEATGYEALYLTADHDLRGFAVAPPVAGTIASNVQSFTLWPVSTTRAALNALAADAKYLTVLTGAKPVARYPLLVRHPVRILVSSTGRFAAVQGEEGVMVWEAADPWAGDRVPTVEALSRELNLYWPARRDVEYHVPKR